MDYPFSYEDFLLWTNFRKYEETRLKNKNVKVGCTPELVDITQPIETPHFGVNNLQTQENVPMKIEPQDERVDPFMDRYKYIKTEAESYANPLPLLKQELDLSYPDFLMNKDVSKPYGRPEEAHSSQTFHYNEYGNTFSIDSEMRERHLRRDEFGCDSCEKTFSRLSSLSNHLRVHAGGKEEGTDKEYENGGTSDRNPFSGYPFNDFGQAEVKRDPQLRTDYILLKCDTCEKTFTRLSSLTNHCRVHASEKPYRCKYCRKRFAQFKELMTHEGKHEADRPFKCTLCGERYAHSLLLKYHQRVHTEEGQFNGGPGSKPFSRGTLRNKYKRPHNAEKRHKCKYCGKAFYRLTVLTIHERTHTGEKPYECNYCGKAFARLDRLRIHQCMYRPAERRPHQCCFCEKSFAWPTLLVQHIRIHTGERPYHCPFCEKSFTKSQVLARHKRIHTGVKPFKCTFCDKAFYERTRLNQHQRVHRRGDEEKHKCPYCDSTFLCMASLLNHKRTHNRLEETLA